ncbi:hypothetical protein O3G_MSEX002131 [Manduca sexta]|uniref:Bromo domain-containing protein n=1 Tax=Manduca sexta TaxID=7130 RepID=A0A921YNR9_MANSE|nr:hypothetical protein O3G_MSEX002131 [Manduca sexta]
MANFYKRKEPRSAKKRGLRYEEVVIHVDALEQLVRDVMKHKDCWPFYEPVSVEDVPDYLDVIEQPIDLTTMKHKLETGEYSTDEELLYDMALRLTELDLPAMPNLNPSEEGSKQDTSEEEGPKSKRPKMK